MNHYRSCRRLNPKELEVYRHLTHWYYVAIREMATLGEFSTDPNWIQDRLMMKIPLQNIQTAVDFLIENQYITHSPDGRYFAPNKELSCVGGVYKIALAQFHREIFDLAARSIIDTPSKERQIVGHTFGLNASDFEKAQAIMDHA